MTPRRAAKLRRRRWFLGLLTAFVLLVLFAFFGLPPIIKSQAEQRLTAMLGRKTTIGKVRVNPLVLSITIEDFAITAYDKRAVFVGWKRLYVDFEALSLVTGVWHFKDIQVTSPIAFVGIMPDGSLNFADILAKLSPPAGGKPGAATNAASQMHPIRIDHLEVQEARVAFRDQSQPQSFETVLGPLSFRVTDFRTVSAEHAPYNFEAVTESGEKLSWQGWINAAPFSSSGELALSGVVLKKYAPYYADRLGVDVVDGRLTVRGRYDFSFSDKARVMKLLDGSIMLRNFKLAERATGESLLELPAADVTGATADGLTLKAAIGQVAVTGGRVRLKREADGTLNLMKLLPPSPAAGPAAPATSVAPVAAPAAPPLSLQVAAVEVRDFAADIQDLAGPRPAQFGISGLAASLKNFTLADGAQMPVEVAFAWQPQGTVRAIGQIALKPVSADLQVKVEGFAVLPFSPYLEQKINAHITQGAVSVDGHATLALTEGQPPAATFEGSVWLEKFGLVDGAHNEELSGFGDLVINGISAKTSPVLTATVKEINLSKPYARVIVNEDGSVNLLSVYGTREEIIERKIEKAAKFEENPPDIHVDRIVIDGGDYSFTDRSIKPAVRMAINQFGGTLTDLSSLTPTKGTADIKAMVNGIAPVAIAGTINPLGANLYLDAKISLKGIDLLPTSPYVGKFAGYELARGKLTVDVQAKVADRKLNASNVITLNQFTFGRGTNSPDATKLPVKLGLALLKDTDGNVVLDVPVEGDLNDPTFRVSKVVFRVIGNLLAKAATSPFSLLGALVGGGGEELAYEEFMPGGTLLAEGSQGKLDTMAKALTARPALNLDIEGGYDVAADGYVLKIKRIAEVAKREIWEEKHTKDPNIPPPDKLEISPEEYATKVKQMFDKKFPPGTEFGTPLPPPPMILPPPVQKSDNFFRRVYDVVTFKEARERKALEKAQREAHLKYIVVAKAAVDAGLPFEEMIGRLAETIELSPDDFRALADDRAKLVRDYLVQEGKISPDRLFLTKSAEAAPGTEAAAGSGPRVSLHLQ